MSSTSFNPYASQSPYAAGAAGGMPPSGAQTLAGDPSALSAPTQQAPPTGQDAFTPQGGGAAEAQQMQQLMQALGGAGQGAPNATQPGIPGAAPQGQQGGGSQQPGNGSQLTQQGNMVLANNNLSGTGGYLNFLKSTTGMLSTAAAIVAAGGGIYWWRQSAKKAGKEAFNATKNGLNDFLNGPKPQELTEKLKSNASTLAKETDNAKKEEIKTQIGILQAEHSKPFNEAVQAGENINLFQDAESTVTKAKNEVSPAFSKLYDKAKEGSYEQPLADDLKNKLAAFGDALPTVS